MVKKLTKHGNSLALILDKPILDLMRIDADTPLELITDGDKLVVLPQRNNGKREKKLREAMDYVHKKYGRMMKRLAES